MRRTKEEVIKERLEKVFNSQESNHTWKDKCIIDETTCELLSDCDLSQEMQKKYKSHIEYIQNYLSSGEKGLAAWLKNFSVIKDLFEVSITLFACMFFVLGTYYEDDYQNTFMIIDLILATIFLIDWVIHLKGATNKWDFVFSRMSFIDMITIVPSYLELVLATEESTNLSFFRVLRIMRAVRILRLFKAFGDNEEDDEKHILNSAIDSSGISKQLMIMGMTLTSVLFIGAGIAHALNVIEKDSYECSTEFDFFTAFYFMIVTSSTLGYGDIYPLKTGARMVSIFLILVMVYVISDQLSRISQLMSNYSKYDRRYYTSNHIVVTGYYTHSSLSRFLNQFYHPDHGSKDFKCIVIGADYPSAEVLQVLRDPLYDSNVKYLEGDPLSLLTLEKANVQMAHSVFILTDQLSSKIDANDIRAILMTRMIQSNSPYTSTYLQLVKTDANSVAKFAPWHHVLKVNEMRLRVLGFSFYNSGLTAVVMSLSTTCEASIPKEIQNPWVLQCAQGIGQELYTVQISPYFVGMTFTEVLRSVYVHLDGILVIGIKTRHSQRNEDAVMVNPINYVFKQNDQLFVIADDQAKADLVAKHVPDHETPEKAFSRKLNILKQAFSNSKFTYRSQMEEVFEYDLWKTDLNGVISGHILIWGQIEDFPEIVRAVRLYSSQPIFLVNPSEPAREWDKIKEQNYNVYYLKGSFMNFQDLYNSAVGDAFAVLVLSMSSLYSYSADSDSVLVYRILNHCFPHVKVITELWDDSYIRFLGDCPKGNHKKLPYYLWPKHVSGNCFFSNYLNSLTCQLFYNPDLMSIFENIIGVSELCERQNSRVHSIKVPESYMNSNFCFYREVLLDLLKLNPPVIPIAIVSRSFDDESSPFEVTLTNPLPSSKVYSCDTLICLGTSAEVELEVPEPPSEIFSNSLVESICNEERRHSNSILRSLEFRLFSNEELQSKIENKNRMIKTIYEELEELSSEYREKQSLI